MFVSCLVLCLERHGVFSPFSFYDLVARVLGPVRGEKWEYTIVNKSSSESG